MTFSGHSLFWRGVWVLVKLSDKRLLLHVGCLFNLASSLSHMYRRNVMLLADRGDYNFGGL